MTTIVLSYGGLKVSVDSSSNIIMSSTNEM